MFFKHLQLLARKSIETREKLNMCYWKFFDKATWMKCEERHVPDMNRIAGLVEKSVCQSPNESIEHACE